MYCKEACSGNMPWVKTILRNNNENILSPRHNCDFKIHNNVFVLKKSLTLDRSRVDNKPKITRSLTRNALTVDISENNHTVWSDFADRLLTDTAVLRPWVPGPGIHKLGNERDKSLWSIRFGAMTKELIIKSLTLKLT